MVTFGIASREENQVKTGHLMRNSRAVIGFWLVHLFRDPAAIGTAIGELFAAVEAGDLEVVIGGVHPLSEAQRGPRGDRGAPHPGQDPAGPRLVSSLAQE